MRGRPRSYPNPPAGWRYCSKCKTVKLDTEFSTRNRVGSKVYLSSQCRPCMAKAAHSWYHSKGGAEWMAHHRAANRERMAAISRQSRLKTAFGLTETDYAAKLAEQSGCCGLCGRSALLSSKRFAVDHDHETGTIRALLCSSCNTGLGLLQDEPALLREAADYIERYREGK